MADIAARVDYGFYAREAAVTEAARDELERLPGGDPWRDYYRGYAAMRLVQIGPGRGRDAARLLESCIASAEAATSDRETALEAWLLVGACSALASRHEPVQRLLHARRFEHALARAREIDPAHPRLGFVAALPRLEEAGAAAATIAALEASVEAFRHWPRRYALPAWGEAEAHALLGAAYLSRNDARRARDHLEQALLAAPGYRDALELLARR